MSIKVIAIGNCLMGDDGVGIRILEKIEGSLKEHGMKTFIGETDFEYCLSIINDNDFIFVIDAAILGKRSGEITMISFDDYKFQTNDYTHTQHLYSLLDLIHIYRKAVKGYVIGIEVEAKNINYSLKLSVNLEEALGDISLKVLNRILESCRINLIL